MMTLLLLLALLWPLGVAANVVWQTYRTPVITRRYMTLCWLGASWPALMLAYGGDARWVIDAWMLGGYWELNALSRPWLAFTALLWALAAVHARGYFAAEQSRAQAGDQHAERRLIRIALLWPLTFLGNLLLIIAQDIASFYQGFALMTFAAYALVVHSGSQQAQLGGKAYLILAVLGEGMILGGLLWAAGTAQTLSLEGVRAGIAEAEQGAFMALLLWLGFGVKAGVIGLHVWLPLAHPVAPAPASAVLSGAMIKAGLLGWINVLPLGVEGLSSGLQQLGNTLVLMGLAAAFGAALYGVWQRHPKAVLAYSSISQMGMLTTLIGMGLYAPDVWPLILPGVIIFAAHHALSKGALFMGTSVSEHMPRWPQPLLFGLMALPGISLTGALAAGMVSKWGVKSALYDMHHERLVMLLTWAAIGTTALVSVCLWRQWQQRQQGESSRFQWGAWLATLMAALITPLWLPLPEGSIALPPPKEWLGLIWPLPIGVMLVAISVVLLRDRKIAAPPAGDLWWLYRPLVISMVRLTCLFAERCGRVKSGCVRAALVGERFAMQWLTRLLTAEGWMRHHSGGLMMAFAVTLALLLIWEGLT